MTYVVYPRHQLADQILSHTFWATGFSHAYQSRTILVISEPHFFCGPFSFMTAAIFAIASWVMDIGPFYSICLRLFHIKKEGYILDSYIRPKLLQFNGSYLIFFSNLMQHYLQQLNSKNLASLQHKPLTAKWCICMP